MLKKQNKKQSKKQGKITEKKVKELWATWDYWKGEAEVECMAYINEQAFAEDCKEIMQFIEVVAAALGYDFRLSPSEYFEPGNSR